MARVNASSAPPYRAIDSDNGSEFVNACIFHYCQDQQIAFTRGRPYKKDDNAHVEQKNWTHVRKLLGWDRYDSHDALAVINDLYRHELRLMMNLFQPSVKLVRKTRVGSRLRRTYDRPQTPLDRLLASGAGDPEQREVLQRLRARLDPFVLAATIDRKLQQIYRLANRRHRPRAPLPAVDGISPRFLPRSRRWNHDWLFRPRPARRDTSGAPVRTEMA